MPPLTIENLTVNVGPHQILRDVSFSVPSKTVVALYGPSGSGKSTTLLGTCGLLDDSFDVTGKVFLGDRDVSSAPPEERSRLGLSIVLQGLALFPNLTALENVLYPLARRGVRRAEAVRMAQSTLDEFRLGDLAGRRPSQLSGGQQQRVALARAMVFSPSVLLLDEPFKGLDQRLRDELLALVTNLARSRVSVLLVTHERREIDLMADMVVSIERGRVVGSEKRGGGEHAAPSFSVTADHVFLPAHGSTAERWVPAAGVVITRDAGDRRDEASFIRASVLQLRVFGDSQVVLLCRYDSGSLAWLAVSNSLAANLKVGDWIRVDVESTQGVDL